MYQQRAANSAAATGPRRYAEASADTYGTSAREAIEHEGRYAGRSGTEREYGGSRYCKGRAAAPP